MSLTVVMPAHNEELEIKEAVLRLQKSLSNVPHQIIVIDDGSTDRTLEILHSLESETIEVMNHSPNRGKGYTLKRGLSKCKSEFVAYLDGDLDLDPGPIRDGLEILKNNPLIDGVIGSKLHKDSEVQYSRLRKFYSHSYRLFVRTLFRIKLSDTQTGLKVFRKTAIDNVLSRTRANGWAFDIELLARLLENGAQIAEMPVKLDYKFATNLNLRGVIKAVIETIRAFLIVRKK